MPPRGRVDLARFAAGTPSAGCSWLRWNSSWKRGYVHPETAGKLWNEWSSSTIGTAVTIPHTSPSCRRAWAGGSRPVGIREKPELSPGGAGASARTILQRNVPGPRRCSRMAVCSSRWRLPTTRSRLNTAAVFCICGPRDGISCPHCGADGNIAKRRSASGCGVGAQRPQSLEVLRDRDQRTPRNPRSEQKPNVHCWSGCSPVTSTTTKYESLRTAIDLEHGFGPACARLAGARPTMLGPYRRQCRGEPGDHRRCAHPGHSLARLLPRTWRRQKSLPRAQGPAAAWPHQAGPDGLARS